MSRGNMDLGYRDVYDDRDLAFVGGIVYTPGRALEVGSDPASIHAYVDEPQRKAQAKFRPPTDICSVCGKLKKYAVIRRKICEACRRQEERARKRGTK